MNTASAPVAQALQSIALTGLFDGWAGDLDEPCGWFGWVEVTAVEQWVAGRPMTTRSLADCVRYCDTAAYDIDTIPGLNLDDVVGAWVLRINRGVNRGDEDLAAVRYESADDAAAAFTALVAEYEPQKVVQRR